MGFDKTFHDSVFTDDTLRVWISPTDRVEIQVSEEETEYAPSQYAAAVFDPKRARKIALAILAAADEAEGVTVTTATQITTSGLDAGGDLTDGALLFVEEGAYAPVYVETRPNVYLSRRQAREAAFAILRHAR